MICSRQGLVTSSMLADDSNVGVFYQLWLHKKCRVIAVSVDTYRQDVISDWWLALCSNVNLPSQPAPFFFCNAAATSERRCDVLNNGHWHRMRSIVVLRKKELEQISRLCVWVKRTEKSRHSMTNHIGFHDIFVFMRFLAVGVEKPSRRQLPASVIRPASVCSGELQTHLKPWVAASASC